MKFKDRITKTKFERKIMREYKGNIEGSRYDEMKRDGSGDFVRLTLYYQDGKHIGTWTNGKGWLF